MQANATEIGNTLTSKAEEYNLTISDAILSPWQDGALAVSDYQTTFDTAMSSTMDQLEALKLKWQEVIDKMADAGNADVANINKENATYAAATKVEKPVSTTPNQSTETNTSKTEETKPSLTKGSYVEVKVGTKWYADSYGGGKSGTAKSGKIKYINTKGSHPYNIDGLGWIKKSQIKGFYKGTKGVDEDQLAWLDELGEELVMHADGNGRLAFLSKGSAVIPHDISENLMQLGALDPSDVLSRNAPKIGVSPSVINNNMEIHVDSSVGTLIHVEHLDGNNPDEVVKIVDKAWEKKIQGLNNSIKKFVR